MGRASTLYEAAIYVRGVLALPGANVREETPAQAQARREKLAEMLAKNERRKAEADADYEAESARLLKFARDLYAGGQS
jgi:hypothetical protein